MRFAKRSSTSDAVSAALLVLAFGVRERRRHARVVEELAGEARFLESLVEAIGEVSGARDEPEILERMRRAAERLFDATATVLPSADAPPRGAVENVVVVPLRVRDAEIGAVALTRAREFDRGDIARAHVLADFAGRAIEKARLLSEAQVREAERARLSEQLITAEQDERRRLALFLHDTSVQSLSGIALMLDAGLHSVEAGDVEQAKTVIASALQRHRATIGSLRDLSFNLEPVVLRDQGFVPAVQALVDQLGLDDRIQVDLDVGAGDALAEKAQAALYQIIREALNQAVHRGPPTKISVRVSHAADGGVEALISDDAPGERRRRSFEALEERARTLNGHLDVDHGDGGGTTVRITVPSYVASG